MASAFWLLLAGAGIADGKASVLQTKSYSIKQNGNYAFTPDAGYDGFSSINVSVAVEAKLQEKSITPTKQEQTVTPDAGFEGLSKIVVGAIPASYIDTSSANATSPDILAPKTAFVKGELVTGTMQEYDGSVTNGTEGMKPQLNAPTIAVSGRQLTINNPSTNGNFTEGYKIFVDGVEKSEQTANTLDLYSYFDEDGTYQLSVAAAAAQFADSNQSAQATYQKETSTNGVVWLKNAEPLSIGRRYFAGTENESYALFAGGNYAGSSSVTANVDVYDKNLTKGNAENLSQAIQALCGVKFGSKALFAGGFSLNGQTDGVNIYDNGLVKTNAQLSVARSYLAGACAVNYCFFAGGESSSGRVKIVDAFDSEFTLIQAPELLFSLRDLVGGSIGEHAIFAGGRLDSGYYQISNAVHAYSDALTKTSLTPLQTNMFNGASGVVGQYLLFAGGMTNGAVSIAKVQAYDTNLTKVDVPILTATMQSPQGSSIGDYALFTANAVCNEYNQDLTRSINVSTIGNRYGLSSGRVGNYMLFAGGTSVSEIYSSLVDVYTVKE